MLQGARKRTAMTLVELLVVMAIIVIFTAMTAAFYPANQADRELSRFSITVQSALLSARNRAKAERLPTGIRFYADPNLRTKVGSVVLIQKPAPLDGLSFGAVGVIENPPNSGFYYLNFVDSVTATGVLYNGGEYIVLDSGETARLSTTAPMLLDNSNTNTGFVSRLIAPQPPTFTKYKIYRSPVELSGDTPFELSNTIEIQMPNTPLYRLPKVIPSAFLTALPSIPPFTFTPSFTKASYFPPQQAGPPPIPPQQFPSPPTYMEIIFNPDGTLNNFTSDVYLHLHNFESLFGTPPSYSDGNFSRDAILAVRKMSGSIGVYEVGQMINFTPIPPSPPKVDEQFLILYNSANHQPYQFAIDPRNKGI